MRQRRFCATHPGVRLLADKGEKATCSACHLEEEEAERRFLGEAWHREGAAMPDRITIPTADGSKAPSFLARPPRRR